MTENFITRENTTQTSRKTQDSPPREPEATKDTTTRQRHPELLKANKNLS